MISYLLLLLLLLVIILLLYIAYQLSFSRPSQSSDQSNLLIQNQINEFTHQMSDRLKETNERLDQSYISSHRLSQDTNRTLQAVTEKLTRLDETNKQVVGFATQMQSLENILKNPKQRGILGEYFLESLLSNILPPNQFKMQYQFSNSEIVDAVIFVKDTVIPIDAKFSLEKYNLIQTEKNKTKRLQLEKEFKMDVKNRIDETAKYIRPQENTTEFAFMFIPAEGVFYNLLIYKVGTTNIASKDLIEYAFSKRVIIVSPTSFFAYLQTVLQALKSLKVEESVKEVIKHVQNLDQHIKKYDEIYHGIGKNLSTVVNKYNDGYKELKKIDKDIAKITDGDSTVQPDLLDKPQ
ncbi:MAG TPA: DNA recombination protein RmuC [bacterium]|nr:DNA recombination protein RmuC [bacterium]